MAYYDSAKEEENYNTYLVKTGGGTLVGGADMDTWEIIGIVAGVLFCVICCVIFVVLLFFRLNSSTAKQWPRLQSSNWEKVDDLRNVDDFGKIAESGFFDDPYASAYTPSNARQLTRSDTFSGISTIPISHGWGARGYL